VALLFKEFIDVSVRILCCREQNICIAISAQDVSFWRASRRTPRHYQSTTVGDAIAYRTSTKTVSLTTYERFGARTSFQSKGNHSHTCRT